MAKKVAPKKAASAKKAVTGKAPTPVKNATTEKASASEKTIPGEEAVSGKPEKTVPVEKTVSVKKATSAKKTAPAESDTPVKKTIPANESAVPAPTPSPATGKKKAKSESPKSQPKPAPPAKAPIKKRIAVKRRPVFAHLVPPVLPSSSGQNKEKPKKLSPQFLKTQRQKLLDLRDTLLDQMSGVTRDSLGGDGAGESAFGMHQADAGSDSYDRDFALSILSKEQNAVYEIDEAIIRIDSGEYGICQSSGDVIPVARLEAMPFARCTVEHQEKLDHEQASGNHRAPVTSLFGLEEKEVSKPSDDEED